MSKVIRIVYGQTIEADSNEEAEKKSTELKKKYEVVSPWEPFQSPEASNPASVRVVGTADTKALQTLSGEDVPEPEIILPDDPGDVGDSLIDVLDSEGVEDTSLGEGETSSDDVEVAEDARGPEPDDAEKVEELGDEDEIEVPATLEELLKLRKDELVHLAEELGIEDVSGTKKDIALRILSDIEEG